MTVARGDLKLTADQLRIYVDVWRREQDIAA